MIILNNEYERTSGILIYERILVDTDFTDVLYLQIFYSLQSQLFKSVPFSFTVSGENRSSPSCVFGQ